VKDGFRERRKSRVKASGMQTYRLRLLRDEEILAEELFPARDLLHARLIAKTRILALRKVVRFPFTKELEGIEDG
jgi:hypothetical protein